MQSCKTKKNKLKYNTTYTTGDIDLNIAHFNRAMGTDFNSSQSSRVGPLGMSLSEDTSNNDIPNEETSPDYLDTAQNNQVDNDKNIEVIPKSADSAKEFKRAPFVPIDERKRSGYLRRPGNIYLGNKEMLLKDIARSILDKHDNKYYSLTNCDDLANFTDVVEADLIYRIKDRLLADKNGWKVLDFDLHPKLEQARKKNNTSKSNYDDRLTMQENLAEHMNNDFDTFDWLEDDNLTSEDNHNSDTAEEHKCCICGKTFFGYGNNALPVANGTCCDTCNLYVVIPARLKKFNA